MRLIAVFDTTHRAMKLDSLLEAAGVPHGVVPTPRWISQSCGIAISFEECWRDQVLQVACSGGVEPAGVHPLDG